MDINWELAIRFVTVIVLLGNTAGTVILFVQRRRDKRFAAIEDHLDKTDKTVAENGTKLSVAVAERKEKQAEFERRMALVEQAIDSLPTHEDLRRVDARLAQIESQVSSVGTRAVGIETTVNRISDLLMQRGA